MVFGNENQPHLFMTKQLKWIFHKGESIKNIIDKIDVIDDEYFMIMQKKIRKYILSYLSIATKKNMRSF